MAMASSTSAAHRGRRVTTTEDEEGIMTADSTPESPEWHAGTYDWSAAGHGWFERSHEWAAPKSWLLSQERARPAARADHDSQSSAPGAAS
jgi:hypothetical protein